MRRLTAYLIRFAIKSLLVSDSLIEHSSCLHYLPTHRELTEERLYQEKERLKLKALLNHNRAQIFELCCDLTRIWRHHPDLNWWMNVLHTFALPLVQGTILERLTRLELATSTLARWRSTRWAKAAHLCLRAPALAARIIITH